MSIRAVDHRRTSHRAALEVHVTVNALASAIERLSLVELLEILLPFLLLLNLFIRLHNFGQFLGLLASANVILSV